GGAQHRLPLGTALDAADVMGAALGGGGAPTRVVRHRGGDGDLVPGGDESPHQSRPAALWGPELGRVVVGQQQDPHPTAAPSWSFSGGSLIRWPPPRCPVH